MLATLNPQRAIAVLTAEGAAGWHAAPDRLAQAGPRTVSDLMAAAGGGGRPRLRALMWLAKLGLADLKPPT